MAGNNNETRQIVLGMLEFLGAEYHKSTTTTDAKESIEVAIQCLETAFGTSLRDEKYKGRLGLREMYRATNTEQQQAPLPNPLSQLFGGGNPFAAAGASVPGSGNASTGMQTAAEQDDVEQSLGEEYKRQPEATPEQKAKGDECKAQGNDYMKNGDFTQALNSYNDAIKLDGNNAVYFCNRAAAYQKLNQLDKALRDCQIACQLQPDYARAYGRMGVTYSTLGNHQKAFASYKKAVELEPENESYVNNLKVSEEVIAAGSAGDVAAGGGPPLNLQGLFNNPALINMASQMLQDPNMQNMMRSLMHEYQPQGGSGTGEQLSMNGLFQVGEAMANQIRMANPNLVEEISNSFQQGNQGSGSQPPPGGQNPPGNA